MKGFVERLCSYGGVVLKGLISVVIGAGIGIFIFKAGWEILRDATKILHEIIFIRVGLEAVVISLSFGNTLNYTIAGLLLLVLVWLVGKIRLSKIIFLFRKQKGLFCVRRKDDHFPGRYAIGIVMNAYEVKGKLYYNVLYPNIAGLITHFGIPAENMEILEVEPEDLMVASASLGVVELKKLHDK